MVKVNYQFEKRKKELDKKRKKEQKLRLKQQKKNSQPGEVTVEPQVESSTEKPAVTPQDALPVETPEK